MTSCEDFNEGDGVDIAQGLKEALKQGTDTASTELSSEDGYFRDELVKILLPQEIATEIENFKAKSFDLGLTTVTGEQIYNGESSLVNINSLKTKEDELILGINRAAEQAASDAGPIFFDAITSMSIADANAILFGADTAATSYLEGKTSPLLVEKYDPVIEGALNSVQIGGQSVAVKYEDYVKSFNDMLATEVDLGFTSISVSNASGVDPIQTTDLSAHATQKGLDGLFYKISLEEKAIRENPFDRANELIQEVFSKQD
jgi:hypothetical protein